MKKAEEVLTALRAECSFCLSRERDVSVLHGSLGMDSYSRIVCACCGQAMLASSGNGDCTLKPVRRQFQYYDMAEYPLWELIFFDKETGDVKAIRRNWYAAEVK